MKTRLKCHPTRPLQSYSTDFLSLASSGLPYLNLEAQYPLCAASSKASALGKPIMTPPSAMASSTSATKAGPDPAKAVHASKCFSSRKRTLPQGVKRERRIWRVRGDDWDDVGGGVITVIPSPIYRCRSGERNQWEVKG